MKFKRKVRSSKKRQITDEKIIEGVGVPMKHRKFPKSFWQQPNRPNQNINDAILHKDERLHSRTGHIKITSPPDTNLLFSLFKILKQDNERITELSKCESTSTHNKMENLTIDVAEDEENTKELSCLDDPYMSPKDDDCRGLKKSLRSSKNYSELLSDLVVNL